MKLDKKITNKQYLNYKIVGYIIIILLIFTSGWYDYQRWLNPLNLKIERDPKQHDGSQEFQVTVPFESSITRDDGSPVIIPETSLGIDTDTELSQEDLDILEELRQKEKYQEDIITVD